MIRIYAGRVIAFVEYAQATRHGAPVLDGPRVSVRVNVAAIGPKKSVAPWQPIAFPQPTVSCGVNLMLFVE